MSASKVPVYQNYIGGRWASSTSGRIYTVTNPAHNDQVLGAVQASTVDDAEKAVDAAASALAAWAATPAPQRGAILYKAFELLRERAEDFAHTITLEEGKPLSDARGEVKRAMNIIEYAAGEGRRMFGYTTPSELTNTLAYTVRRPLGVVAIITPWNFPLAIPAWKIAPALVCGNTVVFKPASSAPLSAVKLAQLFEDAGLPKGVLNLITGPGASVGDFLVNSPEVKGVSFTGSTEIGARLYSQGAAKLKKVQCEMGGKNAVIVLADADLDKTVGGVVQAAFGSTGQRCTATSRVILEEPIYNAFMDDLLNRTAKLKIGDGMEQGVDVAPVASESQFNKIMEYIGIGAEEGARLAYGGKALTGKAYKGGYYIQPTIFTDVKPDMRIAQEEIFGPVLTVFKAKDLDEAIHICNSVQFGLSSSIYCSDLTRAFKYVDQVDAGMVHINSPTLGGEVHLPFGGTKASGVGAREQGTEAVNFFSEVITVYVDYAGRRPQAKFI
ncbi:MAG: aldehyde dehydrogenase family protein [SAR202 cluster bacterium]|nr:aldehyde dehydrogenase family protein [SAR202 cluster bacterium]